MSCSQLDVRIRVFRVLFVRCILPRTVVLEIAVDVTFGIRDNA